MFENKRESQKRFKIIFGIELLAIYFSILSVISFVRATEQCQKSKDPLLTYSDFFVVVGESEATASEDSLVFHSKDAVDKVFSAGLSLQNLESIWVEFVVNCPEEYQGSVLHVDLWADGYDNSEQEFETILKVGKNKIAGVLHKGDHAPDEAQFRIFSLDPGEYSVEELFISKAVKPNRSIKTGVIVTFVLFIGLFVSLWWMKNNSALHPSMVRDTTPLRNDTTEETYQNCECTVYWMIGILSVLIFILIYGVHILNPIYTDWLLSGGDLSQHYLGWRGYRASAWHFPLGMMDTLTYPEKVSIIFTDSIPLLAVFFKMLSPILPDHFQYFGLWGMMCFALQGILAARILKNYTKNRIALIVTSLLFVLAPVMIWRMFAHTALAGQWILLLGLELIFAHKKYHNNHKIYGIVTLIAFFSASVHIYFLLMGGIILIGVCILNLLFYREIKKSLLILVNYISVAAIVVALLGGFSTGMIQADAWGLGRYSFNLNALFNPMGWSDIFKDLPVYKGEQYEGFAYLGAGAFLFLFFACISFWGDENVKRRLQKHWKLGISLLCISVLSVAVAMSPVVAFGNTLIADFEVPDFIMRLWSVFRASGRISWIAVYIIMLISCIALYKTMAPRSLTILLLLGFGLQVYDIHSILKGKNEIFNRVTVYESVLQDKDFWEKIANEDFKHATYISSINQEVMYSVTDWALNHQLTVNEFYIAHASSFKHVLAEPSQEELFICMEEEKVGCLKYDLNYYQADGLVVGCAKDIPGLTAMEKEELGRYIWQFGNDAYLNNGTDTESGRLLYPGGLSYGPYWAVPHGIYEVTISGEGMSDGAGIVLYSQGGQFYHDFEVVSRSDAKIQLQVSLPDDVDNLEIMISNNADKEIMLRSIELQYVE